MTQEEWIKKAGKHLPEGGYNIDTLDKCVFMFREGYKSAIKDICEWLKENLPYSSKPPYQVIEDLRKAMEE